MAIEDHASRTLPAGADGAPEAASDDAGFGGLHPLDRRTVLRVVPAGSGVITVFDHAREPLYVEWSEDMRRSLSEYVALQSGGGEGRRVARFFEIFPTHDRGEEAKAFDRLVNRTGRFPSLMHAAPPGARHPAPPDVPASGDREAARVTNYEATTDSKMVEKLRRIFLDYPADLPTQEWLAFTLYSNNLLDEAIVCYLRLINAGYGREEHFFYCANAFFKRGDVVRAAEMWRMARDLAPGSVISRKSAARLEAALRRLGSSRLVRT